MSPAPTATRRARRTRSLLVAALFALLLLAPAASGAERVSFKAKRVKGRTAIFRVAGVAPGDIRRAKVRVGRYLKRVRLGRIRRAARRGKLRVRLPRWVARRLRRRVQISSRRRKRVRLTVVLKPGPSRPTGPVNGPVAGFESGDFSEVASLSKYGGDLSVSTSRAYEGSHSARATYRGGDSGFQRVWQHVNWSSGSDVWYGMALFIPNTSHYCYWNPIRWDNYKSYGGNGDIGGLSIESGRFHVVQNRYGGSERQLLDGGPVPEGRWTWVELHQRFSANDGQALSELYVDGRRTGVSTKANSGGRVINHLRAGVVNVAGSCSRPSAVDFDRFSISDGQRGPLS